MLIPTHQAVKTGYDFASACLLVESIPKKDQNRIITLFTAKQENYISAQSRARKQSLVEQIVVCLLDAAAPSSASLVTAKPATSFSKLSSSYNLM